MNTNSQLKWISFWENLEYPRYGELIGLKHLKQPLAKLQTLFQSVRKLIQAGQFDARISIDRMELIFGIEDLISEGIMSMEEGDEIIKETREVITTEQLLYRIKKDEVVYAYNKYEKKIIAKDLPAECKEILLSPGRDIVNLVSETHGKL